MTSSIVLLISILLPLSLVLGDADLPLSLVVGDADLIQKVCQKTHFPDLCTSTLKASQPSQSEILRGLADEMIYAGEVLAAQTYNFIRDDLVKTVSDPAAVKAFKRCSKDYEEASTSLDRSGQYLNNLDYETALKYINFGKDHVDRCRDSFNPPLSYPDTLKQSEVKFVEFVDVAADIIKQQLLHHVN